MPFWQGSVRTAYLFSTGHHQLDWLNAWTESVWRLSFSHACWLYWLSPKMSIELSTRTLTFSVSLGYWTFSPWLGSKNEHPPRESQADIILLLWPNLRNHSKCHVCHNHKHSQIQEEEKPQTPLLSEKEKSVTVTV